MELWDSMLHNSTGLEESIKLNQSLVFSKMVELENRIADKISNISVEIVHQEVFENVLMNSEKIEQSYRYIISVADEIVRLLTTPIGSRVMRPNYGSELYKLRDREMNNYWRLMAIKYTFIAINRHIKRVRCRKVLFDVQGDGKMKMKLELEKR